MMLSARVWFFNPQELFVGGMCGDKDCNFQVKNVLMDILREEIRKLLSWAFFSPLCLWSVLCLSRNLFSGYWLLRLSPPTRPPAPRPHTDTLLLTPARASALFSKALTPSDYLPSHGAHFQRFSNPSSHCPFDWRRNMSFKHLLAARVFQFTPPPWAQGMSFLFFSCNLKKRNHFFLP